MAGGGRTARVEGTLTDYVGRRPLLKGFIVLAVGSAWILFSVSVPAADDISSFGLRFRHDLRIVSGVALAVAMLRITSHLLF